MSARDLYHDAVKNALVKDGWTITDDPLRLQMRAKGTSLAVDLGAERLLAAARGTEKVAVEVKTFLGSSFISEFHATVGQLLVYWAVLRRKEPERALYLAVPKVIFEDEFSDSIVEATLEDYSIRLLVFDPLTQEVVVWIP